MVSAEFLTAGHAIFTVTNPDGEYYTYRVTTPKDQSEMHPVWFVSLLTGPNNLHDYTYLGLLRIKDWRPDGSPIYIVHTTAKSKFAEDSKPVKVVQWAVNRIQDKQLPAGYDIKHIGRCGVCGRELTTPESIDSGIGPVCAGRI